MPAVRDSAIAERDALYNSLRQTAVGHLQTLETNGWTFSQVNIMNSLDDVNLPVKGGKWFKEVALGKHIVSYDSMLVLTQFKGHALGGFGGALKNIAIGCASGQAGKFQPHNSGSAPWSGGPELMERVVEGGKAVTGYFGSKITYINVLKNMSWIAIAPEFMPRPHGSRYRYSGLYLYSGH